MITRCLLVLLAALQTHAKTLQPDDFDRNGPSLPRRPLVRHELQEQDAALLESVALEQPRADETILQNRWMKLTGDNLQIDASKINLFCFAWTSASKDDKIMLPEIKQQLANCDGHAIFTDTEANLTDSDVIKVRVPSQALAPPSRQYRNDSHWLYHRNMVGLTPAWTHMLESGMLNGRDWVLNVEMDHITRPSAVRQAIGVYIKGIWEGTDKNRAVLGNGGRMMPLMLLFGNAYLFNNELVQTMQQQWKNLSRVYPESHKSSGCPHYVDKDQEVPQDCSQDEMYIGMAVAMHPKVAYYGARGCGEVWTNGRGQEMPLACFQMERSPAGGDGSMKHQVETIRAIAAGNGTRVNDHSFYPNRDIPILHHVHHIEAHVLARKLGLI